MFNVLFGVSLTFVAYKLSLFLKTKFKSPLFNPVLIGALIIIMELKSFNISYEAYESGGNVITLFLTPLIMLLAVPLYKNKKTLSHNAYPILIGVISGIVTSAISIIVLSKLFGIDRVLMMSLIPKSITSPIAIEACKLLVGIPTITILSVIITGIVGAVVAPYVIRIGKIENEVAIGIAIGTSSHAIGTSRALEISEKVGAASSLAMGVTGVTTILIISIVTMFA